MKLLTWGILLSAGILWAAGARADSTTRVTLGGTVQWTHYANNISEVALTSPTYHGDGYDGAMEYSVSGTVQVQNEYQFSATYAAAVQMISISNHTAGTQSYTLTASGNLGSDGSTVWHYVSAVAPFYTISSDQASPLTTGGDPVISFLWGDVSLNRLGTSRTLTYSRDNYSFTINAVSIPAGKVHRYIFIAGAGNMDDTGNTPAGAYSALQSLLSPGNWPADFTSFLSGTEMSEVVNWSIKPLKVLPEEPYEVNAYVGDPITPASKTYVISNASPSAINWTATDSATWISVSPTAGTLYAGEALSLKVSLGTGYAYALGSNTGAVTIVNSGTGQETVRDVRVNIYSPPAPPNLPVYLSPASNAVDVAVGTVLDWEHDTGIAVPPPLVNTASTYRVYFGTNAAALAEVASGLTNTFYDPGKLENATTYYWQISASNDVGVTTGPVWPFTTWLSGPLDHFEWDAFDSVQYLSLPFDATVTARDSFGDRVVRFNEPVQLEAFTLLFEGSYLMLDRETPDYSYSSSYLSRGLRFRVDEEIHLTHFLTYRGTNVCLWSDEGTLLFEAPVSAPAGNWSELELADPIVLSSGQVYRVSSQGSDSAYRLYDDTPVSFEHGEILNGCYSANGFPTTLFTTYTEFIDFRYKVEHEQPVSFLPTNSVDCTDGVWTGSVTVFETVPELFLRARSADGTEGLSPAFSIDYIAALALEFPAGLAEGDGVLTDAGRLLVSKAPAGDLTVDLAVDAGAEIVLPAQVVIPAGQTQALFDVEVLDDGLLDGSRIASVHASRLGYETASVTLPVHDNESAQLILSLPETTFEGAGSLAGAVMLNAAPAVDVVIQLLSNHPALIGGGQVTVPAGQLLATFSLPVYDNTTLDGIQSAEIEAYVENWINSRASVFVFDDEVPSLGVALPASVSEGDGVEPGAGTVTIPTPLDSDLHVLLTSSDTTELTVPLSVVIPAGQTGAVFNITVIDDTEIDGTVGVSVIAQVPGYVSGTAGIKVLDNEAHHLSVIGVRDIGLSEPVDVTVSVRTIDNRLLTGYPKASITLSAAGDRGPVSVTPATLGSLLNGEVSGSVAFGNIGDDVVLVARTATGTLTGTSTVFRVTNPQLELAPVNLLNTPVVAGETAVRTIVVSNSGNETLEFLLEGVENGETTGTVSSLIAHYPFSGDAADASGNGHDGTVSGAILSADRFGNPDSAYDFNGSSAFINCGNLITNAGSFTVSAWINIDTYTDSRYMGPWSQQRFAYPAGNCDYHMYTANDTSVGCFGTSMRWFDGTLINSRNAHVVPVNEWHLITQTYDGVDVRQYDNGVLVNTTSAGPAILSNGLDFLIGKACAYPGYLQTTYFDGQIDDLRVYSRALTDAEIQDLYHEGGYALSSAPTNGLVAYYPFNGNAVDASGNGADGTAIGAALTGDRSGHADQAYHFDEGTYIATGQSDGAVDVTDQITISAWVRPEQYTVKATGSGVVRTILRKKAFSDSGGYDFLFDSTGRLGAGFGATGTDGKVIASDMDPVPTNTWSHVAVTFDENHAVFYVDGTSVSTQLFVKAFTSSAAPLCIGRLTEIDDIAHFYGDLDEIRIYDRLLSDAEILMVYQDGEAPTTPPPAGPATNDWVAYYPLDGDAVDASGNGADGIVESAIPTVDRRGYPEAAYLFDEGAYIRTTATTGPVDIVGQISMAGWINPSQFATKAGGTGTMRTILRKLTSLSFYGYAFMVNNEGRLAFDSGLSFIANTHVAAAGMAPLATNRWSHVAMTYDGAQVLFYVDGVAVDARAYSQPLQSGAIAALCIGRHSYETPQDYFYGAMDELSLFDRVLSPAEVAALYTGTEAPEGPWVSVDRLSGNVPPGGSVALTATFDSAGLTAGEVVPTTWALLCNDRTSASNLFAVSMVVTPPAPEMEDEPAGTFGTSNTVAWSSIEGPVRYRVEIATATNTPALGQSGWSYATNHTFEGLSTNVTYYYRARASVNIDAGLFEGPWSDWVSSTQLPMPADADGDGMPDWWEILYFGDTDSAGAVTDTDGDGQTDYHEFVAGMDPTNAASSFAIYDAAVPTNGQFVIYWDAATGRVYSVHWKPALTNSFEPLATDLYYPQDSYTDAVHGAEAQGFYQVEVEME